jgi:diguanylate cyclase (GGDEF)-like protein
MALLRLPRSLLGRLPLTRQVALLSLLPMLALGFVLARFLQSQVVDRALADSTRTAGIIAHLGVQPRLTPANMRRGLPKADVGALDRQLGSPTVGADLARIKVWNAADRVIYSEDHSLIGQRLVPSDDLEAALEGHPKPAQLVEPSKDSETASEVGLGELIEVYVPLRFSSAGRPAGAFEIYLSYRPLAAAIARDKRTIAMLLAIGLALLWAILYRIVARASRRLRRQSTENYRLARYDPLTGLGNRNLFTEQLARAARRGNGRPAVLLIDIERFTEINNTLGSANGDQVLREAARRFQASAGEATVARVGGDEYAVLYPNVAGSAEALELAEAMHASLELPISLDGVELDVEASVGVAVLGEHAEDPDVLLQRADLALAHARSHGSRVEVYAPEFERSDPARLKLLGQVRGALAKGEFILHYQPKVALGERTVVAVEALVRWEHPEHGLLAPGRFIPLIEQTALIGPLTLELIEQAITQAVDWRRRGATIEVSVNLSARNLLDTKLPGRIAALLSAHGLPAEQLIVEVTESSAMADPDRAVGVLRALREMGLGISIDDFGTGNASIAYLANLPATELKIDRSFVTGIAGNARSQAIVAAAIELARSLGLRVVAEGIETDSELECLIAAGCEIGQGFLFSRPLPAAELTARPACAYGLRAVAPVGAPARNDTGHEAAAGRAHGGVAPAR